MRKHEDNVNMNKIDKKYYLLFRPALEGGLFVLLALITLPFYNSMVYSSDAPAPIPPKAVEGANIRVDMERDITPTPTIYVGEGD